MTAEVHPEVATGDKVPQNSEHAAAAKSALTGEAQKLQRQLALKPGKGVTDESTELNFGHDIYGATAGTKAAASDDFDVSAPYAADKNAPYADNTPVSPDEYNIDPSKIRIKSEDEPAGGETKGSEKEGKEDKPSKKEKETEKEKTDKESEGIMKKMAGGCEKFEEAFDGFKAAVSTVSSAIEHASILPPAVATSILGKLEFAFEKCEPIIKQAPLVTAALIVADGIVQAVKGHPQEAYEKTATGLTAVGTGAACAEAGSLAGPWTSLAGGVVCGLGVEVGADKFIETVKPALEAMDAQRERDKKLHDFVTKLAAAVAEEREYRRANPVYIEDPDVQKALGGSPSYTSPVVQMYGEIMAQQ